MGDKIIIGVLILVIGLILGTLIGAKYFTKKITETKIVEISKVDTIYKEKIKTIKLKAKTDTIFVNNNEQIVSFNDTTYQDEYITLDVAYYHHPYNLFRISYKLINPVIEKYIGKPIEKIIYQEKEKKEKFLDRFKITAGYYVGYDNFNKKYYGGPGVGLSFIIK